ncbi:MAG: biliverdin-producing heme oxygenase [Bacteroidota bacterium]
MATVLHELLRSRTALHHRRVEALPCMARLLRADYQLDEYRALLLRYQRAYRLLEERLQAPLMESGAVPDLLLRIKTPLLIHDLTHVGAGLDYLPTEDAMQPLWLSSPARALGTLYVLEGATLGGRIIARHLAASLDVGPQAGASFFHAYGTERGRMWRAFLAHLEVFGQAHPASTDEVVAGACSTFDYLHTWLSARPLSRISTLAA